MSSRSADVNVRLTSSEMELIRACAAAEDRTVSSFVRHATMGHIRRYHAETYRLALMGDTSQEGRLPVRASDSLVRALDGRLDSHGGV